MPKKKDKTMKEVVEGLLVTDPRTRSDPAWLLYRVWRYYTNIFIDYNDFKKLPKPESVMRTRRNFQNIENKYNTDKFEPEEGVTYEKKEEVVV